MSHPAGDQFAGLRLRADSTGSARGAFYPDGSNSETAKKAPKLTTSTETAATARSRFHAHPQSTLSTIPHGALLEPQDATVSYSTSEYHKHSRTASSSYYFGQSSQTLGYGATHDDSLSYSSNHLDGFFYSSRSEDICQFAQMANPESRRPPPGADVDRSNWWQQLQDLCNPSDWLKRDLQHDPVTNSYYFESSWTLAAFVRAYLYNPVQPEFDSIKLFSWGIVIGIAMGLYCTVWKWFIEAGVDFLWEAVPATLYEWGIFTDAEGAFPIYNFIWIVPAVFGGLLSYIFAVLPKKIPSQDDWIRNIHSRGVQTDYDTFFYLFFLSTAGMWSGLSLGPELPLVLTAGMAGSWLGLITGQSMLQARVLNLTTAGAAVGGFFSFPMAGALFVLELPHREGLQYFEALSPSIVASIVSVLTTRIITGEDVTGYFRYPFLTLTLPSIVFVCAVFYGLYGCFVGRWYCKSVKKIKVWVHDWFQPLQEEEEETDVETVPLVQNSTKKPKKRVDSCRSCLIFPQEPRRAAVAGTMAGLVVGGIGMFLPHIMFWGEAQLQNLIDKGRTPLPVFGGEGDHVEAMTSLSICMIDPNDEKAILAGFGIGCSLLISMAKTLVIGLSLGTGIIGGHFWGPLYVGCAASHLLADVVQLLDQYLPLGPLTTLAAYPCLTILCTMGSAHVVTFRAHVAIMLILTLTISSFDPETIDSPFQVAGDYSAVFPLLVVSVFVSLYCSRDTKFYSTQRPRGDITAIAQVLCQPGKVGAPLVVGYENEQQSTDGVSTKSQGSLCHSEISCDSSNDGDGMDMDALKDEIVRKRSESITNDDIEKAFATVSALPPRRPNPLPFDSKDVFATATSRPGHKRMSSRRLDELLGIEPEEDITPAVTSNGTKSDESSPSFGASMNTQQNQHRRTHSAPMRAPFPTHIRSASRDTADQELRNSGGSHERRSSQGSVQGLVEVSSFGHIDDHQPDLLDQARSRAASIAGAQDGSAHGRSTSFAGRASIPRPHLRTPSEHRRTGQLSGAGLGPFLESLRQDDFQTSL